MINIVGLDRSLMGSATPLLSSFARRRRVSAIKPAFPAVTCTAQSNYLTGSLPTAHGIVGNGWYDRNLAEIHFWKQSNHLVTAPKIWDELRRTVPGFTCANIFWWYNMYSTADYSITPRPMYPADGRKLFDIYSWPYSIRSEIKRDLGEFPFATFWGPAAGSASPQGGPDAASLWIAASAKWIEQKFAPTLSLIYLPHLDYNLQRLGPAHPAIATDLGRIDAIAGDLIAFFEARNVEIVLLSEYGITEVNRPIHLNRMFRARGWLTVKDELGREMLDAGASKVFAVADHQVAHVYLNDTTLESEVRGLLESVAGIGAVLGGEQRQQIGLDHPRAGDLIAAAEEDSWFTYYYWMEDDRAPDFSRCVDIHRKPGYDPVELFLDPSIPWAKAKILWRLAQKKLGFRMLMDVIPLDASLVKGSHGSRPSTSLHFPILAGDPTRMPDRPEFLSTEVYDVLKWHVTGVENSRRDSGEERR